MALKKKVTRGKTVKNTLRSPKTRSSAKSSASLEMSGIFCFLGFGVLFGYFLSKARATDYDTVIDMFRPQNLHVDRMPVGFAIHWEALHLYGVIITAIVVIGLGLLLLERAPKPTLSGKPLDWEPLQWDLGRLPGAFLFGAGWALAGTCPGTSLAQIGEGKLVAFATVLGILAGVWAYKKFKVGSSDQEPAC
jgi:uncharacterized membrane protein YedE/YeeE